MLERFGASRIRSHQPIENQFKRGARGAREGKGSSSAPSADSAFKNSPRALLVFAVTMQKETADER
jgi:hypothetical protein